MSQAVDIEKLHFEFQGVHALPTFTPLLVGVVGSGNLEVLLEPAPQGGCTIDLETSARGFGAVWQAVLSDFHERNGFDNLRISINDMGATPAVVSLRLMQAVAQLHEATS
jgi:malonate decarboxylase delta subunit